MPAVTAASNIREVSGPPGDSPVINIPEDYFPAGSGRALTLPDGDSAGRRLFFWDHNFGRGDPERTIVLVHGNPESSYTFRRVVEELEAGAGFTFRVVALDHLGFGLSDRAPFEMDCPDHAANLSCLIEALDLQKVVLVVHDWGGPIGIGAFLRRPERVSGLVLLNTTVFPFPETGWTFGNYPISWLGWSRTPRVIPDRLWGAFASYAVFRSRAGSARLLGGLASYAPAAGLGVFPGREKTARRLYYQQFGRRENVRSSKRLVSMTPFWGKGAEYRDPVLGHRDNRPFYRFIQDRLSPAWGPGGANIPVRAVFGGWDPLARSEVRDEWIRNLPQLEGAWRLIPECGHFIEEERPGDVAEAVIRVAGDSM